MEKIAREFYDAFKRKDSEGMIAHYHPNITFEDPAFGELSPERTRYMWQMLCKNGADLKINYSVIQVDDKNHEVWVSWDAEYTFRKTGRKVINSVHSDLLFDGDKIIKHIDSFNLKTWASQALGLQGKLLGNTHYFKKRLQKKFNQILDRYIEQQKKTS